MTEAIADDFDLTRGLGWKVREPRVGNAPHSLRYGLNSLARRATNNRIGPERPKVRACFDLVQDCDLGEEVANCNRRVPRHFETRRASCSMLPSSRGEVRPVS
jgi:hypothetical protein